MPEGMIGWLINFVGHPANHASQSEIPEGLAEFFTEFPEEDDVGYDADEDQVFQCLKSLYGLKQAPRQWEKRRTEALAKFGFTQLRVMPRFIYTTRCGSSRHLRRRSLDHGSGQQSHHQSC